MSLNRSFQFQRCLTYRTCMNTLVEMINNMRYVAWSASATTTISRSSVRFSLRSVSCPVLTTVELRSRPARSRTQKWSLKLNGSFMTMIDWVSSKTTGRECSMAAWRIRAIQQCSSMKSSSVLRKMPSTSLDANLITSNLSFQHCTVLHNNLCRMRWIMVGLAHRVWLKSNLQLKERSKVQKWEATGSSSIMLYIGPIVSLPRAISAPLKPLDHWWMHRKSSKLSDKYSEEKAVIMPLY